MPRKIVFLALLGSLYVAVYAPLVISDSPLWVEARFEGECKSRIRLLPLAAGTLVQAAQEKDATSWDEESQFLERAITFLDTHVSKPSLDPLRNAHRDLRNLDADSARTFRDVAESFRESSQDTLAVKPVRGMPTLDRLSSLELFLMLLLPGWLVGRRFGFRGLTIGLLGSVVLTTYWKSIPSDLPSSLNYKHQVTSDKIVLDNSVAPLVTWGANEIDTSNYLAAPGSPGHLFGTDRSGRDVLARLIMGFRMTWRVAVVALIAISFLGVGLGMLAGLFPSRGFSSVISFFQGVPGFLIIMALLAFVERGPEMMGLAIGILSWPEVARLTRAEFMSLRQQEFIWASRALGTSPWSLMIRQMLPNAAPPILVALTFATAGTIFVESSLSFLGIGLPDHHPSWGACLAEARFTRSAWWLSVFPGSLIFLTILTLNRVAESLQMRSNERLTQSRSGRLVFPDQNGLRRRRILRIRRDRSPKRS